MSYFSLRSHSNARCIILLQRAFKLYFFVILVSNLSVYIIPKDSNLVPHHAIFIEYWSRGTPLDMQWKKIKFKIYFEHLNLKDYEGFEFKFFCRKPCFPWRRSYGYIFLLFTWFISIQKYKSKKWPCSMFFGLKM